MKPFVLTLLLLCCAASTLVAQQESESQFMVVNYNKVAMEDFGFLRDMWVDQVVPVLKGMMEEGLLSDYGLMEHAWGDEWNFCFYFVTKDHASFLTFWDEYIKRMSEKYPDSLPEYLSRIKEHKDNMYTLRK